MVAAASCRLYLITPPLSGAELDGFVPRFTDALSNGDVASALVRVARGAEGEAKRIIQRLVEAAAAKIFIHAAARNNPIAQNRLAHLYLTGRGVPRDLAEAATWNRFAKAGGLDDADLDAATANLTPEENERVNQLMRRQATF